MNGMNVPVTVSVRSVLSVANRLSFTEPRPQSPQRAPHDSSRAGCRDVTGAFCISHLPINVQPLRNNNNRTNGNSSGGRTVIRTGPFAESVPLRRLPPLPCLLYHLPQVPPVPPVPALRLQPGHTVQRLTSCLSPTSPGPLLQPGFFQPLPLSLQRRFDIISIIHFKQATSLSMAYLLPPVYYPIRYSDTAAYIALLCLLVPPFTLQRNASRSSLPSTSCIDYSRIRRPDGLGHVRCSI